MSHDLLTLLTTAERLKSELRHSWLSSGRQESVAEHAWQMGLLALLLHPRLEHPVSLDRALRLVLVHDLAEAVVGDVPAFAGPEAREGKAERERAAFRALVAPLPAAEGEALVALFEEYEAAATPEARFVKALDRLEVQLQHNRAALATWTPVEYGMVYTATAPWCAHDRALREFCAAIEAEAEAKMIAGGVDVAAVRAAVGRSPS